VDGFVEECLSRTLRDVSQEFFLLSDVFFYHEQRFCCLEGVTVIFDKFAERFSVILVFDEVEDGGESLVVCG
jgi:hypothetical protein